MGMGSGVKDAISRFGVSTSLSGLPNLSGDLAKTSPRVTRVVARAGFCQRSLAKDAADFPGGAFGV